MKDINFFKLKDSLYLKEISSKAELLGDDCDGYLIRSSESEARRIIESLRKSGKRIGFMGGDDALNRRAVESLKIDFLVSSERDTEKDSVKQRDSGLNHVVAKIAKEKGVLIVVDMGEISRLEGKKKAERIARVMQNVRICRKVGCGIGVASFARKKSEVVNELGRRSFGVTLGMDSSQSVGAVEF